MFKDEESKEQREQRILESIKNIKDDLKDSPKVQGTGKTKWRSMEEIKQEMKDIDLKVTEDYLSMKELLEGLDQEKEEENQVNSGGGFLMQSKPCRWQPWRSWSSMCINMITQLTFFISMGSPEASCQR